MTTCFENLPDDLASAHAMILAQRELLEQEQSARIMAQSEAKLRALEVERLTFLLAKARREAFGQSSERGKLPIEQLELAIEDLEESQGQEEAKAGIAAPAAAKEKRARAPRGPRKPPIERTICPSSARSAHRARCRTRALRLRQMRRRATTQARRRGDEDAGVRSAPLEHRRTSARKVHLPGLRSDRRTAGALASDSARLCGTEPAGHGFGGQVPAASAAEPPERGLCAGGRRDRPVDARRSGRGASVVALDPILGVLCKHVLAAERIHTDDATVPVLAKKKTRTGRIWVYLRDDRPFGGKDPPAAFLEYSASRHGEYPRKLSPAGRA